LIEFVSQRQCNLATSCRVLHRGVETEMCLFPVDGGILAYTDQSKYCVKQWITAKVRFQMTNPGCCTTWLRVLANYWGVKAPEIEKRRDWIFGDLPLSTDG